MVLRDERENARMSKKTHKKEDYTRIMQRELNTAKQEFGSLYAKEDFDKRYSAVKAQKGKSAYFHRLRELNNMFEDYGIDYEGNNLFRDYHKLSANIPTRKELVTSLFVKLYDLSQKAPTPEDYMKRLVWRLVDEDFKDGSVRLAILKQFMRHTDYNTAAILRLQRKKIQEKSKGKIEREVLVQSLSEEIFERLPDTNPDGKKKYPLLHLAEDLASGKFRTNGRTKVDLYMFAFAFGMTVYSGAVGDMFDPERDVEKNLFHDYYNDNLLRYISRAYLENKSDFEEEPTGEGINYKNFAEIIYLYYIHKEGYSPREKIRYAEEDIEKCKAEAIRREKEKGFLTPLSDDKTQVFKEDYFAMIMQLKENQLVNYLCNTFNCSNEVKNSKGVAYKISPILVSANQHSAKECYREIEEKIRAQYPYEESENGASDKVDYDASDFAYGLAKSDRLVAENAIKDKEFKVLVDNMNVKLQNIRKDRQRLADMKKEAQITRTQLISIYYAYFSTYIIDEGIEGIPEIYEEFCAGINPYLERARFQKISEKNMFDTFIIFILFLESIGHEDEETED